MMESAVPEPTTFSTRGGVEITRTTHLLAVDTAIEPIVDALDSRAGALFTSSYEYPGRYTRWDVGFIDPPLRMTARGRDVTIRALNRRGPVLIPIIARVLQALPATETLTSDDSAIELRVREPDQHFPEELRSRQHSVFSVIRALLDLFQTTDDPHLGLYGAFGYDLAFQFDPVPLRLERGADQRDLVLYVPDRLVIVDHSLQRALEHRYEVRCDGVTTEGLPFEGAEVPYQPAMSVPRPRDHEPGEYADVVRVADEWFRRGDLFEVVPSQTFVEPCRDAPSAVFRRLRARNPAPYGFFMNLGEGEYLVGASPEMYVRVNGRRVESCPVAGTIARAEDVLGDEERVRELLNSAKDTAELTMCTDVDRNDKSRICEPGSVKVIGRRLIDMYSKLIHTADHVEGQLREGFDALDAFLTHAWAVTITGAPKLWAMRFIEEHERAPRRWYGGAVGWLGFDGNMNTGLTLRTLRIANGVAEVRAGATLLVDSVPEAEERETELKASALLEAVRGPAPSSPQEVLEPVRVERRVLLIDHEDSFVHTLANYLRQTGAEVLTLRPRNRGEVEETISSFHPDLVVLSPGPGEPSDFDVSGTVAVALAADVPVFGVCLGLQGIVEHFGGRLGILAEPVHGKASQIRVIGGRLFQDLPRTFLAGRYHSLHAIPDSLPADFDVTAVSEDGVIMAIEHRFLPVAAVQFHPESIMTSQDALGLRLLRNVIGRLQSARAAAASEAP